ncbi:MAG: T9SS type A sorting domain-containing protein [Paludibacteraceae bacterium]|nr:T9SS type A sorting domain-containing protein [Paludibacteraceae bacterium]
MKRCFALLLLVNILSDVNADKCSLWMAEMVNNDTAVCHSEIVNFDVILKNDSMHLDSCLYEWFLQMPEGYFVSQGVNRFSTFTYTFNQSGVYHITCKMKPDTCNYVLSDTIAVTVYSELKSGAIFNDDTICYNTQPNVIQSLSLPTGCDGQYVYQWQDSVSGGFWRDIPNSNNITYQAGNLIETTYFRRKVLNIRCGAQVFSAPICVEVRSFINAPVISQMTDTICYNSVPSLMTIDTLSQRIDNDSILYCWQYSDDGMDFVSTNQNSLTFTDTTHLKSSRYYRVKAVSMMCNDSIFSDTIKVNVYAPLVATICADTSVCNLTSATLTVAVNGVDGKYNYQWYESNDGYSWNVVGTNSELFNAPIYGFGIHYYKCDVTSQTGCGLVTTSICTVTTYVKLVAGEISCCDTICCGENVALIQSMVSANGCDNNYNYTWQKSNDQIDWQNTTGRTLNYSPGVLTQTTYFRRMVTNQLCSDTAYSNVSEIYVMDSITSPIVSQYNDTICYGSRPDSLRILTLSRCDIYDSITYIWQESVNGVQWNNVFTGTAYQPSSLVVSVYYRIMAVSKRCAMVKYSNVVKVNVFDSLVITNNVIEDVCNMDPATLTFESISGAGGRYHYQWQESTDGGITFADIKSSANTSAYNMSGRPGGDYYFRCVITPLNGCDGGISEIFRVHVYEEFLSGFISCSDTVVCENENSLLIIFSSRPSGGTSDYTYQWMYSEDGGVTWQECFNETADTLHLINIQNSTYYKAEVTDQCGTKCTNEIFIKVNPLPDSVAIIGNEIVCSNEYSTYSIDEMLEGFDYEWSLSDENVGNIITDNLNKQTIQVYWYKENSSCKIYLKVTNTSTLCETINFIAISTSEVRSPDTTIIIHKPNSNILVCQEDAPIFYQWGYTDRTTHKRDTIPDSNRRYVQLPMSFDNDLYDYWLILRETESAECHSESHYYPTNDKSITQPSQNVRVVTNVKDNLAVAIDNPLEHEVSIDLYSVAGMRLHSQELGNGVYIKQELNVELPQGVYFLKVVIGTEVLTYKLLAE